MLAVKFFDDVYYSNAYYAKVGGVRTKDDASAYFHQHEVNALEAQFLKLIEWRLHVTPQVFFLKTPRAAEHKAHLTA
eukprot:6202150-Amphidinium_carterae.1